MGLIGILGTLLSGGDITTKIKPAEKKKPKQDFSSPGKRITDLDHDFRFETIPALLLNRIQRLSNVTEINIRKVNNENLNGEVIWEVIIYLGNRYKVSDRFRSSYSKNTLLEKYNNLLEYVGVVNSKADLEIPQRDSNSRLLTLYY